MEQVEISLSPGHGILNFGSLLLIIISSKLLRVLIIQSIMNSRARESEQGSKAAPACSFPNSIHPVSYNPSEDSSFSSGSRGSTFQILSAYSLIHRSLLKNPIRATLVIVLVVHSSWFLYASSTKAWLDVAMEVIRDKVIVAMVLDGRYKALKTYVAECTFLNLSKDLCEVRIEACEPYLWA